MKNLMIKKKLMSKIVEYQDGNIGKVKNKTDGISKNSFRPVDLINLHSFSQPKYTDIEKKL